MGDALAKAAKAAEMAGEQKLSSEVSHLKELTQKEKEDELKRLAAEKEKEKKIEVTKLNEQMNKLGQDKDQRILQLEDEMQTLAKDKAAAERLASESQKGCIIPCLPGQGLAGVSSTAQPIPMPGTSWV